MYGYVYLTYNIVNRKIYIGQHASAEFDTKYQGSGTIVKRAFKLYGKEMFATVIIDTADSKKELNEKEAYYIKLFESTKPEIGYNVASGGEGPVAGTICMHKGESLEIRVLKERQDLIDFYASKGYVIGRSPRARKSLSEGYNYSSKGMLGKKQSDKQKAAASKACSYKRSDEQRKHFSEAKKDPNKFVCLVHETNRNTIRVLKKNIDKYIA